MRNCVTHTSSVGVFGRLNQGLDQSLVEGRDVVWFSAEDELSIGHDGLVDPVCAGVLDVGLEGWPGGYGFSTQRVCFDEGPGAMTDCGDGLTGGDELADEVDCCWFHAEMVGVHHAARQQKGVVVVRVGFGEGQVYLDGLTPILLVPTFDLAVFGCNDDGGGAYIV